jgi:hypothetical protein
MKLSRLPSVHLFLISVILLSSSLLFSQGAKQNISRQYDATGVELGKTYLEIVNPIIFVFKDKPYTRTVFNEEDEEEKVEEYKAKIILHVWNKGENICFFPTKMTTHGNGKRFPIPPDVLCFSTEIDASSVKIAATDTHPALPLVMPESNFGVAELRQNEATTIVYETFIKAKDLNKEKIIFQLNSAHKGRYSFWEGGLDSQIYPFKSIVKIFKAPMD